MINVPIDLFFHPNHIAVIGVSRDDTAVGSTIFTNIKEGGFQGAVIPINPFLSDFHGHPCYQSILSVSAAVDTAVIAVPAPVVPSVLEEVGKKGIPFAVIISAGFGETGKQGNALEQTLKTIASQYNISVLGPNCLGMINPQHKLNMSFARTKPIAGSIAFISQSGALGAALLDILTPKHIGISHFISVGNKIGIDENDLLSYLINDQYTRVIGIYAEQLTNASALIAHGKNALNQNPPKPIVILKAGATAKGTQAIHSHTGSLAGQPAAYKALFNQAYMIQAQTTQDFIHTLVTISQNPVPQGNACAVLTNAGGPAILAADTLTLGDVDTPPAIGKSNPIDLLGDAKATDIQAALSHLEQDSAVQSVLGIITPQAVTEIDDSANVFCMHKTKTKKPLIVSFMGDGVMANGRKLLEMGKVSTSKYPEQAAVMLTRLHQIYRMRQSMQTKHSDMISQTPVSYAPIDPANPFELISRYGVPTPTYVSVLTDAIESVDLASLSENIAIKLISPDVIHKSEGGGLSLNIPKIKAKDHTHMMLASLKQRNPTAQVSSVVFMDMVDLQNSLECIVGVKKEPGLGTLILLGIGGIFVELINDISLRFAPLLAHDAQEMIAQLQAYSLFTGIRGRPALDTDSLIQTLCRISELACQHPEIVELDINPLLVQPKGVLALDVRVSCQA